jgi:hypothetical protein
MMRELPAATSPAGVCERHSIGKLIGKPASQLACSSDWHDSVLLTQTRLELDRTRRSIRRTAAMASPGMVSSLVPAG